jgi:hypothetical protein
MTAVVIVLVAVVGIFLLTRLSWVISRRERRSINNYGETLDVLAKLSNQSPRTLARSRRGTSSPSDVREPEALDREVQGFGADGPEHSHPRSLIGPLQLGNSRRLRPLGRPSAAGLSGESPYGLGAPGATAFGSDESEADAAGAGIAASDVSRAGRRFPEAGEVSPGDATPDDAELDTLRPEPRPERQWDRPAMVFVDDSVLDRWSDSTGTGASAPPSAPEADPSELTPASHTDATQPDTDPLPYRWSAADEGSGETVIRLGLGEEEPETPAEAAAASAREAAGDALSQQADGPIVFIDDAVASSAPTAGSSLAAHDSESADAATPGLAALGAAAAGTDVRGAQPRSGAADGRRASTGRTRRGGGAHRRRPQAASLVPLALLEGLRSRARDRKRVAAATAAKREGLRSGAGDKKRVAAATAATAGGLRSGAAGGKRVAAATAARVEEGLRSGAGGGKRAAAATAAKLEGLRSGAGDKKRVAAATAATAGGLRSGAAGGKRVAAATAARVEDLSSQVPGGKRTVAAAAGAGVAAVVLAVVLVLTLGGGGGASHASGHRPQAAGAARPVAPPTTVAPVSMVTSDATDATYAVHLQSYTLDLTSFPGPCWVQVRTGSATGPVIFDSVIQANQYVGVPASGPLWVRVGFEANIRMAVNWTLVKQPTPTPAPFNFTFETS